MPNDSNTTFLYIDEHGVGGVVGATGLLVPGETYPELRKAILRLHPDLTKDQVSRPHELHHRDFLPGHDADTKFRIWSGLCDLIADTGCHLFHLSYHRHTEFNDQTLFGMSLWWMTNAALREADSSTTICPVFDVGMRKSGQGLDQGFAPNARSFANFFDFPHLATTQQIPTEFISIHDPTRIGEAFFVDSAFSELMQLCDNLGGLLCQFQRMNQTKLSDFQQRQAELGQVLFSSGLVHTEEPIQMVEGYVRPKSPDAPLRGYRKVHAKDS